MNGVYETNIKLPYLLALIITHSSAITKQGIQQALQQHANLHLLVAVTNTNSRINYSGSYLRDGRKKPTNQPITTKYCKSGIFFSPFADFKHFQ